MRYVFRYLPKGRGLTFLVSPTHESEAFREDACRIGARTVTSRREGVLSLGMEVFRELAREKYDVVLSQGFVSGMAAYLPGRWFAVPHVLTIHGMVERRFLEGKLRRLKAFGLRHVVTNVSALYAVGKDVMRHVQEEIPELTDARCRKVVIPNGIDVAEFTGSAVPARNIRSELEIGKDTMLLGFFGRFMPEKGFDLLIDAADRLKRDAGIADFAILAVGSGDYLGLYKRAIRERKLERYFRFLPFQKSLVPIYAATDVVIMPSTQEASPIVAMEALCMGVPLVASDCLGLRETVKDTPTVVFPSGDVESLADRIQFVLSNRLKDNFESFAPIARSRYDVVNTSRQLQDLIETISV